MMWKYHCSICNSALYSEERIIPEKIICVTCITPTLVEGSKDTNPKDSIGGNKLPLHLWPQTATAYGSLGLLEGASKYGRANWRHAGVRASIYYDALSRHMDAWFNGEWYAPDTGVPHLSNALACLAIIVDAHANGKLIDDRNHTPNKGQNYRSLVNAITTLVPQIKEQFKDKDPKHYTIKDDSIES